MLFYRLLEQAVHVLSPAVVAGSTVICDPLLHVFPSLLSTYS